jgi:cell division septation protein DedD
MRTIIDEEERESTDTEITLGMKSLLGVFFGAVLVCGIFFGFGYSLGRSNAHPAAAGTPNPVIAVKQPASADSVTGSGDDSALKTVVSDPTPETDSSASQATNPPASSSSIATPSAASPSKEQQYEYVPAPGGPARRPVDAPAKPLARSNPSLAVASATSAPAPAYNKPSAAVVNNSTQVAAPALTAAPRQQPAAMAATRSASPDATPTASAAGGATMVQIAAVTHQEDATILVAALRKRGYAVVVRSEPNDSLLHVQLGPFASRDEARAMRAKLLGDGYNAILK